MGKKLVPKIILEGTRLTHKTEIAFALNEHPRIVGPRKYRYHSPIISAEWGGFTNHPWGRGLINFNPDEEAQAMETYETWLRLFELQRYYSWIVDRFHISTKLYQQRENENEIDFSGLEERLLVLNFHLVLCVRSPQSFQAAREERLKVSGNPSQYDVLDLFIDEQDEYRRLVRASKLHALVIDISHNSVSQAVNDIADWLESTGGLWLD